MATRAERFRAMAERKGEANRKGKANGLGKVNGEAKVQLRTPSYAQLLARAAPPDQRRYGGISTGARNQSNGGSKMTASYEDNLAPGRPSRKSTRRSGDAHMKAATPLTGRQLLRLNSPAHKHDERRR